jgi:hypothetical protein
VLELRFDSSDLAPLPDLEEGQARAARNPRSSRHSDSPSGAVHARRDRPYDDPHVRALPRPLGLGSGLSRASSSGNQSL